MKLLLLAVILGAILVAASASKKKVCTTAIQEECESMTSDYNEYLKCKRHRAKRSDDCVSRSKADYCDDCDCTTCGTSNCCTQCCQRTSCQICQADCQSNPVKSCKTNCRKSCGSTSEIIRVANNATTAIRSDSSRSHNITTIIHLNNVINNTNVFDIPVRINNTNFNDITIQSQGGGSSRIIDQQNERCCLTIGPRQCVPQKEFPFMRCFHVRRKACGYICSAPVVHYQRHEICDNDVNVPQPCQQQIVYVPQPQPRCAYQDNWPYVSCGNRGFQPCDGCYGHYINRGDVERCSSFCYDDGFGAGPYYRQGPFYRPGFAPVASCYQTGTCFNFGSGQDGGYGGVPMGVAYPPDSYQYPFIIEDPNNQTTIFNLTNGFNPEESVVNPLLFSSNPELWNGPPKPITIDSSVEAPRSERYAQVKIKPTESSIKSAFS